MHFHIQKKISGLEMLYQENVNKNNKEMQIDISGEHLRNIIIHKKLVNTIINEKQSKKVKI